MRYEQARLRQERSRLTRRLEMLTFGRHTTRDEKGGRLVDSTATTIAEHEARIAGIGATLAEFEIVASLR
jgi:hypothetical protein